jgi:RimJ/RimL family protein N-acetyltransferase
MEIIPYRPEHAQEIYERLVWADFPDITQPIEVEGLSFSALKAGKIIGCAGVYPNVPPGIGLAWMLLTWRGREEGLSVVHASVDLLPKIAEKGKFHRIEAAVRKDWPLAERFVEKIGFVKEGPLRCYDSKGRDYTRYARIFPENLRI